MDTADILLITPPFTQWNTPYPATVFLKGFLQEHRFRVAQLDLGIETLVEVFSAKGLKSLFDFVETKNPKLSANARRVLALKQDYIATVEPVISFLQGKDNSPAMLIHQNFLPRGSRFDSLIDLDWNFGTLGIADKAKYLATLYLEDLGNFITEAVDSNFGFSRYAEHLSLRAHRFDDIELALKTDTPVTQLMNSVLNRVIEMVQPKTIAFTIPFPGNLLSALKSAEFIKEHYPGVPVILGGGFVNTELRQLNEPRLFRYVDYVCLDDGERPLIQLINHLLHGESKELLVRTFCVEQEKVRYIHHDGFPDFSHNETGMPDYSGLNMDHYLSVLEMANPMHRLWTDGRWNKMALAHGCYWHKCSFCDVSLDYIKRFSKADTSVLVDRIKTTIAQTGQRGFHFVDEAAPPTVLRDLALELIRRQIKITWWTNIRFESAFTYDLCQLLAESGCIAVSGGLEVASDRLLALMQKGVTIEQVKKVTSNLTRSGIMVHAYLMYGFPSETEQETIDSLEVVRQLFEHGLVQSAFWHRFALTVHSPVGLSPEKFRINPLAYPESAFAVNEIDFTDATGCDHEKFSYGLKKALYNYMHGQCFDFQMQDWFDFKVPKTLVSPNLVSGILSKQHLPVKVEQRAIWLGNLPHSVPGKKGLVRLIFDTRSHSFVLELNEKEAQWVKQLLIEIHRSTNQQVTFGQMELSYFQETNQDWKKFVASKNWKILRRNGLLFL